MKRYTDEEPRKRADACNLPNSIRADVAINIGDMRPIVTIATGLLGPQARGFEGMFVLRINGVPYFAPPEVVKGYCKAVISQIDQMDRQPPPAVAPDATCVNCGRHEPASGLIKLSTGAHVHLDPACGEPS